MVRCTAGSTKGTAARPDWAPLGTANRGTAPTPTPASTKLIKAGTKSLDYVNLMRFSYESGMRQIPPAAAQPSPPQETRPTAVETSDLLEDVP